MIDPDPDLGQILRTARIEAELTQEEVAAALGVSFWVYNRIENGHRRWRDKYTSRLPLAMRGPVIDYLQYDLATQSLALGLLRRPPAFPRPRPRGNLTQQPLESKQ